MYFLFYPWLHYWEKKQMSDKKFKLIRTIRKDEDVTKLTARLDILRLMMERHQTDNPNYDYAIVDEQGNPAELADFYFKVLHNGSLKILLLPSTLFFQAEWEPKLHLLLVTFLTH